MGSSPELFICMSVVIKENKVFHCGPTQTTIDHVVDWVLRLAKLYKNSLLAFWRSQKMHGIYHTS